MVRPRPSVFVPALPALLCLVIPALVTGCSSPPEQQLLQKYFQASRMRDNTTLANIAMVSFSPTEEGTVQNFDIVNPGQETRRPLKLRELAAAEDAARKADEDFNKKMKEYQDANRTAIERVLLAEQRGAKLKGGDSGVQKAWSELREETAQYAEKLTEARQALAAERSVAEVSVFDARGAPDATKYDGELITKELTIKAKVRTPDGKVEDRDLHVRFTRTELTNGPAERPTVSGRWIITHIGDANEAGSHPATD